MKRHFVPKNPRYGVFALISTLVLVGVVVFYLFQFQPLNYKDNMSVTIVDQKSGQTQAVVGRDQIEPLFAIINDAPKKWVRESVPETFTMTWTTAQVDEKSKQSGKFVENKPLIYFAEGRIYQGSKAFAVDSALMKQVQEYLSQLPE